MEGDLGGKSVFYDTMKTAINRMSFGMAHDLHHRGYQIAVVALAPGWMRTEKVLRVVGVDEHTWRESAALKDTQSTHYVGRAAVALYNDPRNWIVG